MCTKGEEDPRFGEGSGIPGSEEVERRASMSNGRVEGRGDEDRTSGTGRWQNGKLRGEIERHRENGMSGDGRTESARK